MCGRYAIAVTAERIEEAFEALWEEMPGANPGRPSEAPNGPQALPRYNIAPTQMAPVVRVADAASARRTVAWLRWGLVPAWAEDESIGSRLINARVETAAIKPAFRSAWRKRRCLVPATHFFEWRREGSRKQPMAICGAASFASGAQGATASIGGSDSAPTASLLALAGLWERWRDGLESFAILTTAPNTLMRPIHDRMPLILPRERWSKWLDPAWGGPRSEDELAEWSQPIADDALRAYEVSMVVNSPRNDSPQCVEPIARLS